MVAHDVSLRAPAFLGTGAPVLVARTDDDFMAAIEREVVTDEGRAALREGVVTGQPALLHQPVHRTFNVVVLEAVCGDRVGTPRLARDTIESAGFVVRKVRDGVEHAWVRRADGFVGWLPLETERVRLLDPDPTRRHRPTTGSAALDARLHLGESETNALTEATTTLFPMPESVCERSGATLLTGLVPVASSERTSEMPAASYSDEELLRILPVYLLANGHARDTNVEGDWPVTPAVPRRGVRLTGADAEDPGQPLEHYIRMLEQVFVQLDVESSAPDCTALRTLLASLRVRYDNGRAGSLLGHLRQARHALVDRRAGAAVEMPSHWSRIDAPVAAEVRRLVGAILERRLASFGASFGRFADEEAVYVVRCFVRQHRPDGCAPQLVWAPETIPFQIAPWYASGPAPGAVVQMPALRDFSKLKPNVVFRVPGSLMNFTLKNRPRKLLEGKGSMGGDSALEWICGFNIPIITLCAFIVLFIFLILFNLIFWWLPFVKICFPLPKRWKEVI